MKIVRKVTFTIPTWAEYYFATGETSDMTEDEINEAESFFLRNNLHDAVVETDINSASFSWRNDLNNIGGDVVETTFIFFED